MRRSVLKKFKAPAKRRAGSRNALVVGLLLLLPIALACEEGRRGGLKTAAQAADGFALAVRAFQQAEVAAHAQGLVSPDEHLAIQRALLDVANAGIELDNAIRLAHQPQRAKAIAALNAALDSLDVLLNEGVLHVKNPKARQDLEALILLAKSFLATISSVIG